MCGKYWLPPKYCDVRREPETGRLEESLVLPELGSWNRGQPREC